MACNALKSIFVPQAGSMSNSVGSFHASEQNLQTTDLRTDNKFAHEAFAKHETQSMR